MRPAATVLVWLALLVGLLQVAICGVLVFSAGLAAPILLILLLLPFVPLILLQEIQPWRRLDPVVPAVAALISMAISGGFYWMVYVKMD
jgi:hypothetical protein